MWRGVERCREGCGWFYELMGWVVGEAGICRVQLRGAGQEVKTIRHGGGSPVSQAEDNVSHAPLREGREEERREEGSAGRVGAVSGWSEQAR